MDRSASYEPVWEKMTKIPGTNDFDWGVLDTVYVIGKKPQDKEGEKWLKKIGTLDLKKLVEEPKVDPSDLAKLKAVLEWSQDEEVKKLLASSLDKNIGKQLLNVLGGIDPNRLKTVYENLTPQERNNMEALLKKVENQENRDRVRLINWVIERTKIELENFRGQILEQNAAKVENFKNKAQLEKSNNHKEEVSETNSSNNQESISKTEKKNLNKILDGDFLVEEKFNKVEKGLRSDFRKLIDLVENTSSLKKVFNILKAQADAKIALPDWSKLFVKENGEQWTEKELNKLQKAYLAYLESKKDNADAARWNRVMNALESGIINGEKSLDVIYQENVSKPISKKERKQGLKDEQWKFRLELAKDGKDDEWKKNYKLQNRDEIYAMQQNWFDEGYSRDEISKMTEDYLNDRFDAYTKKEWKKHLKEEQKNWIQKSDLGNFRVLVDFIEKEGQKIPPEKQISMLLTDTNFDGVRNHLDGRGTKRGDQIDLAIRMAQAEGLSMDAIVNNIVSHLTKKGEKFDGAVPVSADTFAAWLRSDIKHARLVQSALMDTPENAVDIMRYGENALKKTLEAQNLTPEELKQISDKINTDPATRDLSQQARDTLMANLSSYLLSKMREPGVKANVNGLGVGVNVPLNQILKGLSFTLGTGISLEGEPFVGVSLAWNTEAVKWKTGNLSVGGNVGATPVKEGDKLEVIPIYGLRAGVKQDLNTKNVLGNIDPTSLKSLSVGGNLTMLGITPSWGVSAGIDKDKIGGIEKQYDHIKKEITPIIEELLTKKEGNYPDITATLKTLFKTSSDAEIKKAAENLTSVIERTKAENLDPKEAAQLIGQRYAESWKNNAVQGLPKGWRFTGASLGVQFLAGFFPVATLSATLTKYKNLSHSDSPESRARLQQSIERGRGDVMKESLSEKDFVNIKNQLEAINVLNSNDKLIMNNNWELVLSLSLLNKTGLNVKINKNLKGYIKSENGTLTIPAGVSYRFLTSARTNGSFSELDIGYERWSDKLTSLRAGNLENFVGKKDYGLDQHIEGLKTLLKSFNLANVKIEDWKLFKKEAEIWDLTKDSGEYIAQKNDIKIDPDGTISQGVDNNVRTKIWDLTKDSGLAIDKDWNIKITEEKGKITKKSQPSLTVDDKLNKQVEDLFNEKIIDSLTKLTKQKDPFTHFRGFLEHAKAMKEEYVEAAKELIEMLSWKEYERFRTALEIVEKDGKKVFKNPRLANQLMDRLKAIFATIPDKQKETKSAVVNLATQRNLEYRKHHGRSVLEDFSDGKLKIDYIDLANQLSDHPEKNLMPNLIGFTAFYRRKAGDARGMSMTAYGQTKVLDKTLPVEETQQSQAKKWLLENLDKQKEQLKTIARSIGTFSKATTGVDTIEEYDENGQVIKINVLSLASITKLLKWESVDLWREKITLNTEIVKYFLAECANESIGIQIDSITIEDSQQVKQQPIKMTFNASEATAQANIDKSDFSIGLAFGGGRTEQKKDQKEKTQWGEAPKTQWGDNGEKKGDVNNSINVGDHVEGHIPTGGDISPNNPWKVDGIPWDNPISKENPLWL